MSGVYPIADYFTVFPSSGDVTNFSTGESTFNVPQSTYLSNAKGQYCLISLADGAIDIESVSSPYMISLLGVNNNGGEEAIIGNFSISAEQGSTGYHHTFCKNDVKYLIPARPSQIRIKGLLENRDVFFMTSGYLTFKFEYLSKEAVKMLNDESEYNTF